MLLVLTLAASCSSFGLYGLLLVPDADGSSADADEEGLEDAGVELTTIVPSSSNGASKAVSGTSGAVVVLIIEADTVLVVELLETVVDTVVGTVVDTVVDCSVTTEEAWSVLLNVIFVVSVGGLAVMIKGLWRSVGLSLSFIVSAACSFLF